MPDATTRKNGLAVRWMVGALCAAVGLSAMGLVVFAVLQRSSSWVLYTFEVVTLVASILGLLFATRGMRVAPGLSLLCIAGSVAVAAMLTFVSLRGELQLRDGTHAMGLRPWLAARMAAALVLATLSAAVVLNRDARAWSQLARAIAAGVPVVVIAGAGYWLRGHGGMGSTPPWLAAILYMMGAIVAGVSLCAAGHFLIRAFEIGTDAGERQTLGKSA